MKKLVIIILSVLLFVPLGVDAASISSLNISTPVEQETGNQFYVPVRVAFEGVDKNYGDSGIFEVILSVDYDDSVLEIVDFYSDWFSSTLTKVRNGEGLLLGLPDGNYITSITDPRTIGNKCSDQFLACSDYNINIKFFVKNDSQSSTDIKVEAAAIAFKVDTTLESYTEENMQELESDKVVTTTVKIKKTDKVVTTEPEKNITVNNNIQSTNDILSSTKENATNQNNNSNPGVKSSNNFLSSLQIENYNISFDKNVIDYEIKTSMGVNSLNVIAATEDGKATYNIIGSDNLEENNHQVKVEVTAENGEKRTYTISVKTDESTDESFTTTKKKEKKQKKFKIKLKKEHYVIGGIVLFITLILFIIIKLKDRKIDKALKDL